jgi:DNA-directed RNA polymerase subunit RPC12/RpoP
MVNYTCEKCGKDFLQKYIPENSDILDIGGGYCEFINSIKTEKDS